MSEYHALKIKTTSSMIMSFMGTIGTQFINLLIQIVLARLLMPEDFGIIGMVTVFIALSQVFIDSGFSNSLIREKQSSQEDYSTVFFFNLFMAVIMYIALFFSAGLISQFFREPILVNIIRILSLVLFIQAMGMVQRTMMIKDVNFKGQAVIDLVASALSGILAVILALSGFGVWSLVIRTLFMQLLQTLFLALLNRWIPSLTFNLSSFRRLFNFGWKLLLASLLSRLYENLYYLIIGRVFTVTELGFYTKAKGLKDVAENTLTYSIERVSYPVLSNIQDDTERLRRGYRKIINSSAYIAFPVMLGLMAIAPQLLLLLLGDKWIPAIPYFQILCLGGMLYPLHAVNLNILNVKGRSDLYLLIAILKKIIALLLIAVILFFHGGITILLWSIVANSYISFFLNSYYSKKLVSYSTFQQIKDVFLYFVLSSAMAISILLWSSFVNLNIVLLLILQVIYGIVFYLLFSILLKFKVYYELRDILVQLFKKSEKKDL